MNKPIIEVSGISKTYQGQKSRALKETSFIIYEGDRVGIIGANGSGKTTLFRLIMNFLHPDTGTIRVMGESNLEKAKRFVGFVPEHQSGLENFTPAELLDLAAGMSGVPRDEIEKQKSRLLKWIRLEKESNTLLEGFSKGMIQRVQLGLALVHNPSILLLDEPMSGLDPSGQGDFLNLLKKLEAATFLYASHNMAEIEDLCNRTIIFHKGEIKADIYLDRENSEIYTLTSPSNILDLLKEIPGIQLKRREQAGDNVKIDIVCTPQALQILLEQCKKEGLSITQLRSRSKLEELYSKYVTQADR